MYAIIETGGKQLKVEVGDTIFVEKLDVAEGETVVLDKVLFIGDKTNKIGNPYIKEMCIRDSKWNGSWG